MENILLTEERIFFLFSVVSMDITASSVVNNVMLMEYI